MKRLFPLLAALPTFAVYTYYLNDPLTSINSTNWTQNGTGTAGTGGLSSSTGVSLISNLAVPDGSSLYETTATLTIPAPGTNITTVVNASYFLYLKASANAFTNGSTATGSFYAFEVANPTWSNGQCTATLNAWRSINGSVSLLSTSQMPCRSSQYLHAVATSSNQFLLYGDGVYYLFFVDGAVTTGKAGIGIIATSTGAFIANTAIGSRDAAAPTAVPTSAVSTSVFWNRVEMQWQGASDGANGIGIWGYQMYRNGAYVGLKRNTTFTDSTLQPNTSYQYQFVAMDWHANVSAVTTVNVTTPPIYQGDQWRTGVRPAGNYWGSMGENIDLLSGNLNFSLPLLKAQSRGFGATFTLSYNSQQWRQDANGQWKHGVDSGYGWGWKLQAGALTPLYSDYWTIAKYVFIDATGTEYYFDQNYSGIWKSTQGGMYAEYDANAKRLYFTDGSFWQFDSTAAGTEEDSGTSYPTLMQDTNGNQILIRYKQGLGTTWTNSSARIDQIEDVRTPGSYDYTYQFNYNNDAIPHLTSIGNLINNGEKYTFTYNQNQALASPFNSQSFGTATSLATVTNIAAATHSFTYNGSLELTKATFPYGGYLRWDYVSTQLLARSLREVRYRSWATAAGQPEKTYTIYNDGDVNRNLHYFTVVQDAGNAADKAYFWRGDGLLDTLYERALPSYVTMRQTQATWTTDIVGHPYISSSSTTVDPGQSYAKTSKTEQTLDVYGNMTQMKQYDYGNLSTPARTYVNTFLATTPYTSRHIYNRLTGTTLNGTGIVSYAYDNYTRVIPPGYNQFTYPQLGYPASLQGPSARQHDTTNYGTAFMTRGNLTAVGTLSGSQTFSYNILGVVEDSIKNGVYAVGSTTSTTNYAAPSAITTGNLTASMSYNSFLGLTQESGPNGASVGMAYDGTGRPSTTTSPYGVITTVSYSVSSKTVRTGDRFTTSVMDGLGRPTRVTSGYFNGANSVTVTTTDTEYDVCACSPLGKVKRVSQPYAPGATVYWTTYNYDALGRTISVVAPNNSGTSTYSYQGNKVTTTDPANKWKTMEMDAFGNLIGVTEPKPSGAGATYTTSYTYNIYNKLVTVSMPRDSATQTRTFNYDSQQRLSSVTQPENGTTTYAYNSDGTTASKTDAKQQKVEYTYDSLKRVSQITRKPNGTTADDCQQTNYYYDTNPVDANFTQNAVGRLAAVVTGTSTSCTPGQITEMYSYNGPGGITKKRIYVQGVRNGNLLTLMDKTMTYNYDTQGRAYQYTRPDGKQYTYTYDEMARPKSLDEFDGYSTTLTVAQNAQYNPAGQMTHLEYANSAAPNSPIFENRTYNFRNQLTNITANPQYSGAVVHLTYNFSATQNNGKITSMADAVSGETVNYVYDELQRLISASTSGSGGWGMTWLYDGFGNRLNQELIAGKTGIPSYMTVDGATNRITGTGFSYDANGNMISRPKAGGGTLTQTYNVDNRLVSASSTASSQMEQYGYDSKGRRIWKFDPSVGQNGTETWYFVGAHGERFSESGDDVKFGKKLIRSNGVTIIKDRVGSVVWSGGTTKSYYPFGEERTSTPNNSLKFGTYFRDAGTGLDYADQRYFSSTLGRFMGSDPYSQSASAGSPLSWNRNSYAGNDPINRVDPRGLADWSIDVYDDDDDEDDFCTNNPGHPDCNQPNPNPNPNPNPDGPQPQGGGNDVVIRTSGVNRNGIKQEIIGVAVDSLLAGIDPECKKWLETGVTKDFGVYVSALSSVIGHGVISTSEPGSVVNALTSPNDAPGFSIVINDNGAFFNRNEKTDNNKIAGGTLKAQVFILLHEFAHSNEVPGFRSDAGKPENGWLNNKDVESHCSKTLAKF